ncbi:MAG TPA: hypothetical protein VJ853_13265 [Thermoanaerobaculia bacterium]|nr:hypothetical protein [Thermoanaerobaculia bacterium]
MKHAIALIATLFATHTAFPPRAENASAERLLSTIERFGDDLDTIRWGEVPCGFVQKHANTIRTLRAQIVSNEPPVWQTDIDDVFHAPMPPLRLQFRVFEILAADATSQRNPAIAWTDLHAMWILDRSLFDRPEASSIRTALFARHMILDASNHLGPRPEWWREVESFDTATAAARSHGYEVWLYVMQVYKTIV